MFYLPEYTGSLTQWVAIAFAASLPLFFITEATGWLSLGYSKFARRNQRYSVRSQLGMFAIYFPAAVIYPSIHVLGDGAATTWHLVAMALIVVHFGKRCLEVLFVHRYSGVMNGWTVITICLLYSAVSWLLGEIATREVPAELVASAHLDRLLPVGLAVWLIGTGINLYHHVLLARLRKPGDKTYRVPSGGLFRFVACPHYLGEIIAWWGYALIFQHAAAVAVTATMTAYLMGRSHNTRKWYRSHVEGVPSSWRRLVPSVF